LALDPAQMSARSFLMEVLMFSPVLKMGKTHNIGIQFTPNIDG
jgi:hypothetical protein